MIVCGITHEGIVREDNQDFFITDIPSEQKVAFFVVCDGMGGANAGNVASKMAAEGFVQIMKNSYREDLTSEQIIEILHDAVGYANTYVYESATSTPTLSGMGTTLVGGMVISNVCYIANVGDSRAYLISHEGINQMTSDHSLVAEMVKFGKISEEEARSHHQRNLITKAVGVDYVVKPDTFTFEISDGQKLLLCSDGLNGMIEDNEIMGIVNSAEDFEEICKNLVAKANEAGGKDNITAVIFSLQA